MGHREQLLTAARTCLVERGYAHTTARDLVAESGTNLGSIGYHFGSKDALLAEALNEAMIEFTERVNAAMHDTAVASGPEEAMSTAWHSMIALVYEYRPLLVAVIEAFAQSERDETLRTRLAEGYENIRRAGARAVIETFPIVSEDMARSITSFMMAVSDGIMLQWLVDPERTPSSEDLLLGARLALYPWSQIAPIV